MGMIARIFRGDDRDFSNGGVSSRARQVCILNVEGPFEPSDDAPGVFLVKGSMNSLHLVPDGCQDKWTMMGGCFVHTSDSRFSKAVETLLGHRFYGAVALHDRVE